MPTIRLTAEEIRQLVAKGGRLGKTVQEALERSGSRSRSPRAKKGRSRRESVPLAVESYQDPARWLVPVYTYAGDNARDFKARIGRAGHERWAVHRTLAKQYACLNRFVVQAQAGRHVRVTLTRLGPRAMDQSNVVAALKYVQDAVAERFGLDDGSPAFDWVYSQEKWPAYGVRIKFD